MTVPPPATTMAAADSDSDDQERPQKEPEFVVHVVDDHRPPAPPVQMRRPAAAPPMILLPQERPRLDYGGDECGRKDLSFSLFLKMFLFGLVIFMVFMTLGPATQLPKEYRKGSHVFMVLGPIIIGVTAFSWIVLSIIVDNERC